MLQGFFFFFLHLFGSLSLDFGLHASGSVLQARAGGRAVGLHRCRFFCRYHILNQRSLTWPLGVTLGVAYIPHTYIYTIHIPRGGLSDGVKSTCQARCDYVTSGALSSHSSNDEERHSERRSLEYGSPQTRACLRNNPTIGLRPGLFCE